jgi:hypothetical protein
MDDLDGIYSSAASAECRELACCAAALLLGASPPLLWSSVCDSRPACRAVAWLVAVATFALFVFLAAWGLACGQANLEMELGKALLLLTVAGFAFARSWQDWLRQTYDDLTAGVAPGGLFTAKPGPKLEIRCIPWASMIKLRISNGRSGLADVTLSFTPPAIFNLSNVKTSACHLCGVHDIDLFLAALREKRPELLQSPA